MIKRNGTARVFALLVAILVAVGAIGSLSSCAKADEDQIRGIIKETFDALKNPTEDKLAAYLDSSKDDYTKISSYGTDIYEFLKHSNGKLQYEIESIEIKDDKAKAKLRLTNVDLAAASEAASKDITDNIGSYSDILGGENAENELLKQFMLGYYKYVDAATDTKTELVEVTLKKENGSWRLDEESYKLLFDTAMREVKI